jgi:DegV family protein with EDD domain
MQIVTDSGTDSTLAGGKGLGIHVIPLVVNLAEKSYREGIDIKTEAFYNLLDEGDSLPTTSQPSPGDFAAIYQKIAKKDKEILSIHISAGLSGTVNAAINGAKMVPEADITIVDTKTLAAGAGWQVVAAAKAVAAGWSKEKILDLVKSIREASHSIYTLNELKYLIHGGRISHIKGLLASILDIKPMIGVHKEEGNYEQLGQARSFKKALKGLVNIMEKHIPSEEKIVAQVAHAMNPEGAQELIDRVNEVYKCDWLPIGPMSLVLGAHTGRTMVGVCYAPASVLAKIPG